MKPLARVRIVMWQGASLWIVDAAQAREGETGRANFHAHHAIQISLALGGWFRLDTRDAHLRSEIAAVAADTKHVIDAEGLTGIVFIEPESAAGRAIRQRLFSERDLVAVETEAIGDFREPDMEVCSSSLVAGPSGRASSARCSCSLGETKPWSGLWRLGERGRGAFDDGRGSGQAIFVLVHRRCGNCRSRTLNEIRALNRRASKAPVHGQFAVLATVPPVQ